MREDAPESDPRGVLSSPHTNMRDYSYSPAVTQPSISDVRAFIAR